MASRFQLVRQIQRDGAVSQETWKLIFVTTCVATDQVNQFVQYSCWMNEAETAGSRETKSTRGNRRRGIVQPARVIHETRC